MQPANLTNQPNFGDRHQLSLALWLHNVQQKISSHYKKFLQRFQNLLQPYRLVGHCTPKGLDCLNLQVT